MRKYLLATVAAVTLSGAAFAADLPGGGPLAPAPVFVTMNWSGFYFGATVGGQANRSRVTHIPAGIGISTSSTGVTGGLVTGYNMQFNQLVAGVEVDANILSGNGSTSGTIGFPFSQNVRNNWDARVRGRLGYAFDRTLLYVAGGVTFRDLRVRMTDLTGGPGGSISKTQTGWNIGAGAEYAFTNNWIARAEYIYDDLGRSTYGFSPLTAGNFANRRVRDTSHTFRIGLSYLFNTGYAGPVVAKY